MKLMFDKQPTSSSERYCGYNSGTVTLDKRHEAGGSESAMGATVAYSNLVGIAKTLVELSERLQATQEKTCKLDNNPENIVRHDLATIYLQRRIAANRELYSRELENFSDIYGLTLDAHDYIYGA